MKQNSLARDQDSLARDQDALAHFHAATRQWWSEYFGEPVAQPTAAQRDGWASIRSGSHTLIAAPTGSGKTLAAFLHAIDDLLREGIERGLPDETRVVYVSPLKALSADIHKNLGEPRRGIRRVAQESGLPAVRISAAVRTGDTPQRERAAMLRMPPHILVTTPESLYLLLTAERSREMLRTARTIIVDEIHALIESRRGSHLALSLERLDHVAGRRLQRIGLSATQKPIERVAEFLVGGQGVPGASTRSRATIIDGGHLRDLDLDLEVPGSPLEAVMSAETWQEVYDRIVQLIESHRTTLVFVNTRRLAERLAKALSERIGEDAVTAHHGSLAKEARQDAEARLKAGRLRALVATSSLELGIDIGHVDLVCQIGSPRRIAALLQRVGRSGHTIGGVPKGRLFPLTRDDLVECAALLRALRAGELDHAIIPDKPLDVLAQQIAAEVAAEDWNEDALFELARNAHPYGGLDRAEFDDVVAMLARGFATKRGRRAALVHHDAINHRLRGRRGARLAAITSGGAIPEIADFRVVLEPDGTFIGTLNEDFAIESLPGDVFQLGNASWRILRIESGVVRVADAQGQPPTIPFWLGEAPARSDELSASVSALRELVEAELLRAGAVREHARNASRASARHHAGGAAWLGGAATGAGKAVNGAVDPIPRAAERLAADLSIPLAAASQLVEYLAETRRLLGVVPTQRTLVLERFFDDAGGMQLVLHAPFGARVNRAWGLALRKKFCRKFNFELQAAATDDGLLLSLGPQHSFPLDEVFDYLRTETLEHTLVQAVLDSPLFGTRWRWTTTLSLAVPRSRNGRKVAPQIQRMQAEDLLAAAFPDAAACFENIEGEREVPDHPLVTQALRDCLEDAMDLPRLGAIITDVIGGRLRLVARDTPEPSPIAHELLTARPYAFLDDAPLEERRTQAVYTRRALEPSSARDLGALDPAAIDRVREEARPQADNADELHDALLTSGYLVDGEIENAWQDFAATLISSGRAARVRVDVESAGPIANMLVATERLPELLIVQPRAFVESAPARVAASGAGAARHERVPRASTGADRSIAGLATDGSRDDALRELLRGRLEFLGPVSAEKLTREIGVRSGEVELALVALETEGVILRGAFTPDVRGTEWCDRRLLARIHRYTLDRLRAEIQPVSGEELMRFLLRWQHVEPGRRMDGLDGLAGVLDQLDGFEAAAAAWERDILPARVERYAPELLDRLCLSGRVSWARLSPASNHGRTAPGSAALIRSSPIALFMRRSAPLWLGLRSRSPTSPSGMAARVRDALAARGACFADEIASATGLSAADIEDALAELAGLGLAASDGFSGLRALLRPAARRRRVERAGRGRHREPDAIDGAGRWSLLELPARTARAIEPDRGQASPLARERGTAQAPIQSVASWPDQPSVEAYARALLRRYGVVFRRILARETNAPAWRDLVRVYRRLEMRGDVRGGRFVAGMSGEQFALPEAVPVLRAIRKAPRDGRMVAIGAADPLNLSGILTPGERVPAIASNRVLVRDGLPIAVVERGCMRPLDGRAAPSEHEAAAVLAQTRGPRPRRSPRARRAAAVQDVTS